MSEHISAEQLQRQVANLLTDAWCVQAWLGYGEVAFVGFSGDANLLSPKGRHHPIPPVEVETHLALWEVRSDGELLGSSVHPRSSAVHAIDMLVGQRLLNWQMSDTCTRIVFHFTGSIDYSIEPLHDGVDGEVWSIRDPSNVYSAIDANGMILREHADDIPEETDSRPA